jgi:hypothetical protein
MLKTSFNWSLVRLTKHVVNQLMQFITTRLQSALEKSKAAEKIQESPWQEVVVAKLAIKVTID